LRRGQPIRSWQRPMVLLSNGASHTLTSRRFAGLRRPQGGQRTVKRGRTWSH
jgi:hypothetical protein